MSLDYLSARQAGPASDVFRTSACIDHVLIIEDQALIAMAIEDYLRGLGYLSFSFATNPAEAIAAAQDRSPDFITADVQLAPGCGIDAVTEICGSKSIPVLYITGTAHLVRERCDGAAFIE